MWTGQPLKQLPAAVVREDQARHRRGRPLRGPNPGQRHFDALKRVLDRKEPDYAVVDWSRKRGLCCTAQVHLKLQERRSAMKVKDVMHKGVDWVSPNTPVRNSRN